MELKYDWMIVLALLIFGVFTILILTLYMLIYAANLQRSFLRLFPRAHRTRVSAASREATFKVSAWLGGQLLLAGTVAATVLARDPASLPPAGVTPMVWQ